MTTFRNIRCIIRHTSLCTTAVVQGIMDSLQAEDTLVSKQAAVTPCKFTRISTSGLWRWVVVLDPSESVTIREIPEATDTRENKERPGMTIKKHNRQP